VPWNGRWKGARWIDRMESWQKKKYIYKKCIALGRSAFSTADLPSLQTGNSDGDF